MTYTVGKRVSATLWGTFKTGTITRIGRSNVVFVLWDGATVETWVFSQSLSLIH